jgi:hypothetical protein
MGELLTGIACGIVVSLLNKFFISYLSWSTCDEPGWMEDDDDGLSSQSSAIIHDIHIHNN